MVKEKNKPSLPAEHIDQKQSLLIGEITSLLMLSKVHRKLQVRDIADMILPPVLLNQYRIYRNAKGQPIAFVTWARFSENAEKSYLSGQKVLSREDWKSGDFVYVTDFIAPYGHARKIVRDLLANVFPNEEVKALRFIEQGKSRPNIWKFYGVNYTQSLH